MSKTYRIEKTETPRKFRAATPTDELLVRADDLLSREYLSLADSKTLRRTLRLIEGRTGFAADELLEGMAA